MEEGEEEEEEEEEGGILFKQTSKQALPQNMGNDNAFSLKL